MSFSLVKSALVGVSVFPRFFETSNLSQVNSFEIAKTSTNSTDGFSLCNTTDENAENNDFDPFYSRAYETWRQYDLFLAKLASLDLTSDSYFASSTDSAAFFFGFGKRFLRKYFIDYLLFLNDERNILNVSDLVLSGVANVSKDNLRRIVAFCLESSSKRLQLSGIDLVAANPASGLVKFFAQTQFSSPFVEKKWKMVVETNDLLCQSHRR